MPSFDVVSQVDMQEVRNAVDQASRELNTRFDFKDTNSSVELSGSEIHLASSTDDRLKALKPRVAFTVPNALSGEGNVAVDMTFESLDDFTPEAVARKVEPLRRLLEAREKLSHLLTYMDGKDNAEELIGKLLNDKALQQALAGGAKPAADAAG